jgi:uncharacterized protein (TIGR02996 family)
MPDLPILPHEGEQAFLETVLNDLSNDEAKLIYADWLEERGDARAEFLRAFVTAAGSMDSKDFSSYENIHPEWKDLVGYDIVKHLATHNAAELKERVLAVARPALRMMDEEVDSDADISVGASKLFGCPDLPNISAWPKGEDCKAIYNDACDGITEPAGFMSQVNLAEIAHTQAGKLLPASGVLSFFCFQDIDENIDAVGVRALLLPEPNQLQRTQPPAKLAEGNEIGPARRLKFVETLDVPSAWSGPWAEELKANTELDVAEILDGIRDPNFHNLLGYGRETSGDEPTPNKESRHLILVSTSEGCQMHIQIPAADLAARNFDAITLEWVDFD